MDLQTLRVYCLDKLAVEETYPFGEDVAVFKVMGKMFALMPLDLADDAPQTISLKCDPNLAEILRQTYVAVKPGYHMNKRHWNTITCDDTVPPEEVFEWIDNSYVLVVKGLKKADRERLLGYEQ